MIYIPLLICFIGITIIYLISKKRGYEKEIKTISKEDYPLKELFGIGFVVIDAIGIKRFKKINANIFEKLVALYGIEAEKQTRGYIANKIVMSLIFMTILYAFQVATGSFSLLLTALAPIIAIGIFYLMDTTLDTLMKKRSMSIKYDFPEFVSKLALLINAGLTFDAAWEKIVLAIKKDTTLNNEILITYNDMKANIPKEVALRNFARRCKVNFITKFSNLVIQNINKGTSDLTIMLDNLSNECWIERQALAKQKGEEASTKLLFPMMIMLLAVFIITIVPAMLQMFEF